MKDLELLANSRLREKPSLLSLIILDSHFRGAKVPLFGNEYRLGTLSLLQHLFSEVCREIMSHLIEFGWVEVLHQRIKGEI